MAAAAAGDVEDIAGDAWGEPNNPGRGWDVNRIVMPRRHCGELILLVFRCKIANLRGHGILKRASYRLYTCNRHYER